MARVGRWQDNPKALSQRIVLNRIQRKLRKLSARMEQVSRSDLRPEEKRRELDRLRQIKRVLMERAGDFMEKTGS